MIILLSGKAGTGKDTLGDLLVNKNVFQRRSFARYLKEQTLNTYSHLISGMEYFEDRDLKEAPIPNLLLDQSQIDSLLSANIPLVGALDGSLTMSPRSLLILEGQTKRMVDNNYWVDRVIGSLEKDEYYVITDCRFPNEIERTKEIAKKDGHTVVTIRLERDGVVSNTNSSETALDDYDFDVVLKNDGTPVELYMKAINALSSYTYRFNPTLMV